MTGPDRSTLVGAGAVALALGCATALLVLPLPSLDAIASPGVAAADPGSANAFVSHAPFDPARDPTSATGRLPGAPSLTATAGPVLAGILSRGGVRKAMFSGTPGRWLAEGEQSDNWTVLRIQSDAVVLSRGEERAILTFDDALRLRAR